MSIYHTSADIHADPLSAALRACTSAFSVGRTGLSTVAVTVRSAVVRRWTQRRLTRLSAHMLRDFGFEREWDGTIRSLRDAD